MAKEWYYRCHSGVLGPFSPSEMKELVRAGRIDSNTPVKKGGDGQWYSAVMIQGLFESPAKQQTELPPQVTPPPPRPLRRAEPLADTTSPSQHPSAGLLGRARRTSISKRLAIGSAVLFLLLLLVAGGVVLYRKPSAVLTTEQVVSRSEQSVALVKGRFSQGAGFLVQKGIVVTNKHVLNAELIDQVRVHFPSAKGEGKGPFVAQLLYEDPKRDLAFLSVKTSLAPLTLATDHSFRRGQEVIVIGSPGLSDELVLENAVSRGVLSTQTTINGSEYYQLGVSINSGIPAVQCSMIPDMSSVW